MEPHFYNPADIYLPVKECIQLKREKKGDEILHQHLALKGMNEIQINGIIKQTDEVWYTMQMARKRMIEGAGIAVLSIGGSIYSFLENSAVLLVLYGAAATGLGLFFWGVFMKQKVKQYL